MIFVFLLSTPESQLMSVPKMTQGNPERDRNPEMFENT